jgi:hypothetical protein
VPKSRGRDKRTSTPPPDLVAKPVAVSPTWWAPVMVGLMIIGLLWVVIFYITGEQYPIPALGRWNLGVGFALMLVGFGMTTRWR